MVSLLLPHLRQKELLDICLLVLKRFVGRLWWCRQKTISIEFTKKKKLTDIDVKTLVNIEKQNIIADDDQSTTNKFITLSQRHWSFIYRSLIDMLGSWTLISVLPSCLLTMHLVDHLSYQRERDPLLTLNLKPGSNRSATF